MDVGPRTSRDCVEPGGPVDPLPPMIWPEIPYRVRWRVLVEFARCSQWRYIRAGTEADALRDMGRQYPGAVLHKIERD